MDLRIYLQGNMRFRQSTVFLLGSIVFLLGALVILGWAFNSAVLVKIYPTWPSMTLYTALSLCLAGLALVLPACLNNSQTLHYIRSALGLILVVYGCIAFTESLLNYDLGIELHEMHRRFNVSSPWPGRMDATTALCIVLLGTGFILLHFVNQMRYVLALQALLAIELLISTVGLVGYVCRVLLIYSWSNLSTMAVHTAIGMFLAGIGLWLSIRPIEDEVGAPVRKIIATSTMLLILVGTLVAIIGFTLSQREKEQSFSSELALKGVEHRNQIDTILEYRTHRAEVASYLMETPASLAALTSDFNKEEIAEILSTISAELFKHEFSGVAFENLKGERVLLAGELLEQPTISLPVKGAHSRWLMWADGYLLRVKIPLFAEQRMIGYAISDQPIARLNSIWNNFKLKTSDTEVLLCGAIDQAVRCYPTQPNRQPFNLTPNSRGSKLPISMAMEGESGQLFTLDYQQVKVLADYGPIGRTGLGLVAKVDTAVLFQPEDNQFLIGLPLIVAFILLGVWLMHQQVRPLLKQLRDAARMAENHAEQLNFLNKQLENRADQAEEATRTKSTFLANMSHEIRTPMNAIIGLAHLMSRDARDFQQKDRLSKIDNAAKHLLQIINDILDLSKIEAGKMTLEKNDFSVDEMLSRVFALISDRAREKELELVLDTDNLPKRLVGDSTRLSQMLINLLANSVKFTSQGWIGLKAEVLSEDRNRLQIKFEVSDTGEGISPEAQTGLFNAFEQADNTTTRRFGGTGLGLSLTRHLALLMGGEIGVSSSPGEGSTFWFTAWLDRAPEAGDNAAPIQLKGLRALLVDDLAEALKVVKTQLQHLGFQVDAVESGHKALRLVRNEINAGRAYDVILIDWRMEPMDGVETRQQLQKLLGDGLPSTMLITAFDELIMWQQARKNDFDAVLVKPITASALHDTLVKVLRGQVIDQHYEEADVGESESLIGRRHKGQRILLVEDNPVNQEVAQALLRRVGLVVETADDGNIGVELALSRQYDLILMDMQMPTMDGVLATRLIRKKSGGAVPIIAMTANAFTENRKECIDAGMNDHIPKPVNPEALYSILLKWLPVPERHPQAPSAASNSILSGSLQDKLKGMKGISVSKVMSNINHDPQLLEKIIHSFIDTYRGGEPALLRLNGHDSRAKCLKACHSLRGACVAIGATEIENHLLVFEEALSKVSDPADMAWQAKELHNDIVKLVNELSARI